MKKFLSIMMAVLMFFTTVPSSVFAAGTLPGAVPEENYLINTNKYMTRLHTNINGEAEFELGFKVRFEGEEQDRFTAVMGENLLKNGQIRINNGKVWTFPEAGMKFATAKSKSSFLTINKEFIREFYQQDQFQVTVITPEGYQITTSEAIQNNMDAAEREAFENSLQTQQVDKTQLQEKITKLRELLTDGKKYPQAAVEAAQAALASAEAVSADPAATQEAVAAEVKKLDTALEGMKEETSGNKSAYTIDTKYTFLKNQYGSKVFRIDIKEFASGSDPAKQAFLDTATISINGTDFGSMKALGFTITNYYGFELADLTAIKSVIKADVLHVVLTEAGETTSFEVKNELTPEERGEIAGTEGTPEKDGNTIGATTAILVKSDDHSQPSMSGTTMKKEAEMLTDEQGAITMVLHFEPAVIMGILAYATDLKLNDGTTEFVMKEDNSAVCIATLPAFTENEKIFPGHIYSSVMDADVALKVQKPGETKPLAEALTEKIAEVETMLQNGKYYENTKLPVETALEAAKNTTDSLKSYTDLVKAVAGLKKIAEDPFSGDTVFHVGVVDTSIIGSKSIEPYAKVEIVGGKKVMTVHYNSYLDWDGEIYVEGITVLDTEGKEIPSEYKMDSHKNGTLTFEMPYVPASGLFDVKLTLGNGKEVVESEIQMDYANMHKGPFRQLLTDAIEKYGKYTAEDWNTRLDMAGKKDDFTTASWTVFEKALQKAQADLTSPSLTQDQIEKDIYELREARRNLVYLIQAGNGDTANAGIDGLNNPQAPYYSDTEKEYPEYVGWGGSKVIFGKDGDVYRVLDTGISESENTGRMLLMAENLRIRKPFTDRADDTEVRWKDSLLRQYMNGEFYNTAFSEIEKSAIAKTTINTMDYTDGFMGPPAKLPDTTVTTEDYIFAPDMQMLLNERYGFGSKDSRIVPSEYTLREVFIDMFGEYVTLGVSPKGRIAGTYSLASKKMEAPACMYVQTDQILMTVDAGTGIPQGMTSVQAIDTNLWKFVMLDESLKLEDQYQAEAKGNTVRIDMGDFSGTLMAVVVEGTDFRTGKMKSYGIVDPAGFEVPEFDQEKDQLYVMAVVEEDGRTAYASNPVLTQMVPEKPVEKEELQKTLGQAEDLLKKTEIYTEVSLAQLADAVRKAQEVLGQDSAQEEIDGQTAAVRAAIAKLEKVQVPTATPTQEPVKPTADPTWEPVKPTAEPTREPVKPTVVPTQKPGPAVKPVLGGKVPQTGDLSGVGSYAALMGIAVLGMGLLYHKKRRINRK